jgi:hypothetical protein
MPAVPFTPAPSPAVLPDERVVGDIEAFLADAIAQLGPDAVEGRRPGPGRPRVLPGLCLWAGLLVCVLRGFGSQLQLWRLLSSHGLWRFPRVPITDQALYNRLARAGTAPLEQLFAQVSQVLAGRLAPYADTTLAPFAAAVVALDESTLDQVARLLPALRALPAGDPGLLPGKLAGLFDVRLQQWRQVLQVANPLQNGKVAARDLLSGLVPGTLILADLGYFGFEWFDDLTDRGFHWLSRLRAKTSYVVIHSFYEQGETFDGIVWLGAYRADQAAHAVRLVQFRVGQVLHQYVTNVRDPYQLPPREVARLYARRWDIELAFLLIKRHLGLHLLWACKPVAILQQVWAVLTIAQIFQALRQEIAGRAQVDLFDVSTALLVQEFPTFAAEGQDPLAAFVTYGRAARYIRPSSRTRHTAPALPPTGICPLPADLVLRRTPRYAHRKCDPRPRSPTTRVRAPAAPPARPP